MRSSRARSSVNDPVFLTAFVLGSGSGAWLPLVQRPHHRYARHHDDAAMIGSIEQKARGDVQRLDVYASIEQRDQLTAVRQQDRLVELARPLIAAASASFGKIRSAEPDLS